MGRDKQKFLAKCGVNAGGTSRKDAFCTYAILDDEVLIVGNATQDVRFLQNPLVTGEMHIRFYAGAPLIVRPGIRLGTLCIIDTEPREFSKEEASRLQMPPYGMIGGDDSLSRNGHFLSGCAACAKAR